MAVSDQGNDELDGHHPHSFLTQGKRAGDYVFVSGQGPLIPGIGPSGHGDTWMPGKVVDGGVAEQTAATLANVRAILETGGGGLGDIIKIHAYLRDIDRDFHEFNRIYMAHFPGRKPARTTVQAQIYGHQLVEIDCVAYLPVADQS
jgi:enamine deaminase RidA (YjgF/YER057c/UK114 family)